MGLFAVAFVLADEVDDCKCPDGYHATKDANTGGAICSGDRVFALRPCNVPQRPRCVCGEGVTAITNDATGTWCTKSENGEEVKRWACENEDEWKEFFEKYPDEKP